MHHGLQYYFDDFIVRKQIDACIEKGSSRTRLVVINRAVLPLAYLFPCSSWLCPLYGTPRLDSGAFSPSSSSPMPFEQYLQHSQEPSASSSSSPSTNDYGYVQSHYPSSLGSALDLLAAPPPLKFQTPQFTLGGPSLAPGRGAETLPADLISSPESLTSAWIANAGLTPYSPEDVYVQLRFLYLSLSTSLGLFLLAQNIFIPIKLLRAITSNWAHSPARLPFAVPSSLIFPLQLAILFLLKYQLPSPKLLEVVCRLIPCGLLSSPHHPLLVYPCIHLRGLTSYPF